MHGGSFFVCVTRCVCMRQDAGYAETKANYHDHDHDTPYTCARKPLARSQRYHVVEINTNVELAIRVIRARA